jgi:tetraacyldisaccharide 4'-kinase
VPLDEPAWWYGGDPKDTNSWGTNSWGMATWLAPLAALYGRAASIRYAWAKPHRSRLPVICVGNFTAGGTGKTPLVAYLCGQLQRMGERPAVLTRGYGGSHAGPHWVAAGDSAADVGDEALLLARKAPTLVARARGAGARAIEATAGAATVIVMDDGLQNPQLAKDLCIAVVDAARGLGNGRVIPAGPLRAPLAFQLGLANAIVVNAASPDVGDGVAQSLGQRFHGPVLRATTVAAGDASWLKGQRVVAWAGIGAPQRFFGLLQALGAELCHRVAFRDHQPLVTADAERLLGLAREHKAKLVSTAKDLARLQGNAGALAALAAATQPLPIRLAFADPDAARLDALLAKALEQSAQPHPPPP